MCKYAMLCGVRNYLCILFIGILIVLFANNAFAHKIKIFAMVEGAHVSGNVYFPGGGRAHNVAVSVRGPQEQMLDQVRTNEEGEFSYTVKYKCDQVLLVDTGDGHKAVFRIEENELPDNLPVLDFAGSDQKPDNQEPSVVAAVVTSKDTDIEAVVSRVVSRYIRPLREQLEQYENAVRMRDILGGIGYILGIMGILALFLKKKEK